MATDYCTRCGVYTPHRENACVVCRTPLPEGPSERELEDAGQVSIFPPPESVFTG